MSKVKRILFGIVIITCTSCGILYNSYNRVSYSTYIDGYWGEWNYFNQYDNASFYGNPSDFIVYCGGTHKSYYAIKVVANNCYLSPKDNSRTWYEYNGYITYKTNNLYDGGEKCSREYIRGFDYTLDIWSPKQVTRPATIKIYPKRDGFVYNIFFDSVGLGLNIPWHIAK